MAAWKEQTLRVDNGYVVELVPAGAVVDRLGNQILGRTLVFSSLDEAEQAIRDFAEEVESARPAPMPQVPQAGATVQ